MRSSGRLAEFAAYAAAALSVVGLARFAAPVGAAGDGTTLGLVLAAAPHLVLLVGVWPRLNLPPWAAAAGLVWLIVDLSSDLLAWSGTPAVAFLGARYVGHLFAAIWIVAIALHASGATRAIGVALAIVLGGYTFVAPWVPPVALAPTGPLLVAWWIVVGRALAGPTSLRRSGAREPKDASASTAIRGGVLTRHRLVAGGSKRSSSTSAS